MDTDKIKATGRIIEELFNFDWQIEELCTMSEMGGIFDMSAEDMIKTLWDFVEYSKSLEKK